MRRGCPSNAGSLRGISHYYSALCIKIGRPVSEHRTLQMPKALSRADVILRCPMTARPVRAFPQGVFA